MNEELTIAVEELRQRDTNQSWFIPVQLNKCKIPDRNIGGGETLNDIQHVKLYTDWEDGIQRIVKIIQPESSEKTLDESRISIEIDPRAASEHAKGLACQNELGLINHPEERQEKIKKTLDHFSKAIKIQPDYVHALNARGGTYVFMEKYDDALKNFTKALSLDPDYFVAYFNRGTTYKILGRNKEAIEDYSNVIKMRPDIPKPYLSRGEVFLKTGNYTQAIKDYTQVIELESGCFEAYFNRASAYNKKGVFGLAIEDFTQAIILNPDFADIYCYRGIVWLLLKDWDKARSDFSAAQERSVDIITVFNTVHENISVFEQRNRLKLPEDIVALLTPREA